jgi:site-specific recombinase XerD
MTDIELAQMPGAIATPQQLIAFTRDWLGNRRLSRHTRAAYEREATRWIQWCDERALNPFTVKFTRVNAFARELEEAGLQRRSVARALAAISSWYEFLVRLEAVEANPATHADRPRIDPLETKTIGFDAAEARALVAAARGDTSLDDECALALMMFLVNIGARVSEVCGVDLADLGWASGHRVVVLHMKGGKTRRRTIPPALGLAIDGMLAARAARDRVQVEELTGRLFVDSRGRPVVPQRVARFVRRAAHRAGLPGAGQLTPHSFRHGWNTIAAASGSPLEVRQHALGHVDPRTTQGYDRNREQLDQDPSYAVAAAVAV